MRKNPLVLAGSLAVCVLLLAAAFPTQVPASQRKEGAYVEWLTAQIGKTFSFYPDRDVAVEGSGGEFKLTLVGQDFVTFESKTEALSVPTGVLRVVVKK